RAWWGAALRPACERLQLFGGERSIGTEGPASADGPPGRHPALQPFLLERGSPRKGRLVLHQRKCGTAFAMTGHTSRIENTRNLAIPGHRRRHDVVRLSRRAHPDHNNACEEDRPFHGCPPELLFRTVSFRQIVDE